MLKCGYQVCCQSCRLKVTKAGLPNSKFHRQHLRCLVLNSVASTETRQTLACEWFDRFDYAISTISTILYDSMNILNIIKHQIMSNHTDVIGRLSHPKRHGIAHRCNSSSAAWRIKRRGRQCLCLLCQWSPPLALSHGFVLFFWATMMNCPLQEVLAIEE